jgi:hypothetical protein
MDIRIFIHYNLSSRIRRVQFSERRPLERKNETKDEKRIISGM